MTQNVYDQALNSLSASNLMGLAKSLHEEIIPAAREEIKSGDAPCGKVCDHPAVILMLDQMNQLRGGGLKFSWAYETARIMAGRKDGEALSHEEYEFDFQT
jgi:hypothetical protein